MSSAISAIHGDPIAPVILGVTSILAFAIVGRLGARKLDQPTVLGELLMGILLGNIAWYFGVDLITVLREGPRVFELTNTVLLGASVHDVAIAIFGSVRGPELASVITGPHGGEVMQVAHAVDVFSRYGVIFLLFVVGLETDLVAMRRVGGDSIRVAALGLFLPVAFGLVCITLMRPDMQLNSGMFVAAALGATSIGITANVLKEMNHGQSREGRTILGAAICDDILGLLALAVVTGIIVSGSVDLFELFFIFSMSCFFLVGAVLLGPYVVRSMAALMRRLDIVEAKMFTSYLFVMLLAWMANLAGLATIIGAFAAGVIMRDSHFAVHQNNGDDGVASIRELVMPLEVILVPIFFILMGMQVKVESFLSWPVLGLAAGLLVAAIAGKLLSGLGAKPPSDRLIIGLGMLPRGEVGLVFAAIGRTLGVIDDSIFAAVVIVVFVTTLIAPPLLKLAISRQHARETAA